RTTRITRRRSAIWPTVPSWCWPLTRLCDRSWSDAQRPTPAEGLFAACIVQLRFHDIDIANHLGDIMTKDTVLVIGSNATRIEVRGGTGPTGNYLNERSFR